jgi:DNA-binding response OmpR family regulator
METSLEIQNEKIKILMIEDNPGDVRLVQELLQDVEPNRFSISSVDRISKGVEYLQTNKTDLVLLDLSLPDSIGLNTLLKLKETSSVVPIIILAGSILTRPCLKECLNGVEDYLIKGHMDGFTLKESILSAIKRHEARGRLEANFL